MNLKKELLSALTYVPLGALAGIGAAHVTALIAQRYGHDVGTLATAGFVLYVGAGLLFSLRRKKALDAARA